MFSKCNLYAVAGGVALIYLLVQKVLPLTRQRQNVQKLRWEASFPR